MRKKHAVLSLAWPSALIIIVFVVTHWTIS